MARTHYETLGVAATATPEEVKKARFRLVRRYPPEQFPEEFKAVEAAYKVLADPAARADYDAELAHGGEIGQLMAEADALMSKGEWAEAARRLKRVIVLYAGARSAWNLLGICHTNTNQWEDAKKVYARLVKQAPDAVLYRTNYAWVFLHEAGALGDDQKAAKARLAAEARRQVEEARKREPDNPDHLRLLARAYAAEDDHGSAADQVEAAIRLTKGAPDPEAYLHLARMYSLAGRRAEIPRVADRLAAALPPGPEARKYPALVFAKFAVELHDQHVFPVALVFMTAAARINPDEPNIRAAKAAWDEAQAAADEYDLMESDAGIISPIKALLAVYCDEARNLKLSQPREAVLDRIIEALKTYPDPEVVAAAVRIRTRYPALYRLNPKGIDDLARPVTAPAPAAGDEGVMGWLASAARTVADWFK